VVFEEEKSGIGEIMGKKRRQISSGEIMADQELETSGSHFQNRKEMGLQLRKQRGMGLVITKGVLSKMMVKPNWRSWWKTKLSWGKILKILRI
jgi:hypothetical protein